MYALLLLITFVAGTNYANNLILGLCFFVGKFDGRYHSLHLCPFVRVKYQIG